MKITNREKQIIQLVADELTTKEIAARLYISNETVTTHRRNLMEKLHAKNAAGLIRRGFENGLLNVAMMMIITLYSSIISAQDVPIGIEVDTSQSILFGAPFDSVGGTFFWSPRLGTLIAGTDDGSNFYSAGSYDFDSLPRYTTILGQGNFVKGAMCLASGSGNEIESFGSFSTISGIQNRIASAGSASNLWGVGNVTNSGGTTIWGSLNSIEENSTLSTVWGNFNEITGPNATSWGLENKVGSFLGTAFGNNNQVRANGATAFGEGNIAQVDYGLVIGTHNDTLVGLQGHPIPSETLPIFVIGNGTGAALNRRSNALSVFGNGRMKLGKGEAASDLHIKQSAANINGLTGGIRFEATFGEEYWQIYNSGTNFSFAKEGTRRAYITPEGVYTDAANFLPEDQPISKSKQSYTDDIMGIDIGQQSISKSKKKIKVNSAQLLKNYPDMIIYDENDEPFGIDYRQLYLTALKVLQEEVKTNEIQSKDISSLKDEISELKKAIQDILK